MENKIDLSNFVNVLTIEQCKCDLTNRFKQRRKEIGYSQKELAQRSDVSYASIRRFEAMGEISLISLLKLSHALGILHEFTQLFATPLVKNLKDIK
ncbi:MAG: helix-turn-helix transcriptional regulator [Bacilli bacterium]|nr:helix-turn-helix transcriptional regulator [Bacilli bacterium]